MTHQEETLAGNKSIGFDYQFYYFFYLALGMRHGQSVGLEARDDIHVEFEDGSQELIQAKHTIQKNADSTAIALTNLDIDLWKTLYNWSKAISESQDSAAFVATSTFTLLSNKTLNTNKTLNKIAEVRMNHLSIKDFKLFLANLINETTSESIKSYIKIFKSLSNPVLRGFLNKIEFSLEIDELIKRIQERLLEKIHLPERVKTVYDSLHSELRDAIYEDIKAGKKIIYSFDTFTTRFGKCFKSGLSTKLPIRKFEIFVPENPNDQHFIRQLIDIGDLNKDESDQIIQYITQMLTLYNQLKEWESNGELLASETEAFDKNSILIWKIAFRSRYRSIKGMIEKGKKSAELEDDIQKAGLACLDEIRRAILTIDDNILSTELSNGHFYLLAQQKKLGWHLEWETKY